MTMRIRGTGRVLGRVGLLAALGTVLGAHGVNSSAAEAEQRSMTVRYGDLNLSSRQGIDTLHRRIRWAAEIVCGGSDELRDPIRAVHYHACVSDATNRALEKVQLTTAQLRWEMK